MNPFGEGESINLGGKSDGLARQLTRANDLIWERNHLAEQLVPFTQPRFNVGGRGQERLKSAGQPLEMRNIIDLWEKCLAYWGLFIMEISRY